MDSWTLLYPAANHRRDVTAQSVGQHTREHTHIQNKPLQYPLSLSALVGGRRGVSLSKAVPMATYRWLTSRWCSCRDNLQCVASLWEPLSEREEHIVGVCCRGCRSIKNAAERNNWQRHRKQSGLRGPRLQGQLTLNPKLNTALKTLWMPVEVNWMVNSYSSCKYLLGQNLYSRERMVKYLVTALDAF